MILRRLFWFVPWGLGSRGRDDRPESRAAFKSLGQSPVPVLFLKKLWSLFPLHSPQSSTVLFWLDAEPKKFIKYVASYTQENQDSVCDVCKYLHVKLIREFDNSHDIMHQSPTKALKVVSEV